MREGAGSLQEGKGGTGIEVPKMMGAVQPYIIL